MNSEYFECSGARRAAAQVAWLPDAYETFQRLETAILKDDQTVSYLCDRLRERARLAGATSYAAAACDVEAAVAAGETARASAIVIAAQRDLETVGAWLLCRIGPRRHRGASLSRR